MTDALKELEQKQRELAALQQAADVAREHALKLLSLQRQVVDVDALVVPTVESSPPVAGSALTKQDRQRFRIQTESRRLAPAKGRSISRDKRERGDSSDGAGRGVVVATQGKDRHLSRDKRYRDGSDIARSIVVVGTTPAKKRSLSREERDRSGRDNAGRSTMVAEPGVSSPLRTHRKHKAGARDKTFSIHRESILVTAGGSVCAKGTGSTPAVDVPQIVVEEAITAPQKTIPAAKAVATAGPSFTSLSAEDRRRFGLDDDENVQLPKCMKYKELAEWLYGGRAEIEWLLQKNVRGKSSSDNSSTFGSYAPAMARTLAQLRQAGIIGPLALLQDTEQQLLRAKTSDDDD